MLCTTKGDELWVVCGRSATISHTSLLKFLLSTTTRQTIRYRWLMHSASADSAKQKKDTDTPANVIWVMPKAAITLTSTQTRSTLPITSIPWSARWSRTTSCIASDCGVCCPTRTIPARTVMLRINAGLQPQLAIPQVTRTEHAWHGNSILHRRRPQSWFSHGHHLRWRSVYGVWAEVGRELTISHLV